MMLSAYGRSAQAAPADPFRQGEAYLENGERDKAIDAFTAAIRLNPDDARAYYLRASLYQRSGDADKAAADLTRAIGLDPKGLRDYFKRGWAYGRNRDIDKTIAWLTKSIRACSDRDNFFQYRGFLCFLKYEFDRAIADFTEATSTPPGLSRRPHRPCVGLLEQGRPRKGDGRPDRGHSHFPKPAGSLRRPGLGTCEERGDFDKALADSAEALRLAPDSGEAFAVRGYALEKNGELEKAKADYARAVKLEAGSLHEADLGTLFSWLCRATEDSLDLPVYWPLNDPELRKRIHISLEQEQRIREVTDGRDKDTRWYDELADLPGDQRETAMEEAQARRAR